MIFAKNKKTCGMMQNPMIGFPLRCNGKRQIISVSA